ncbi:MAG: glycosyltransferase family 39 protein [Candidatus Portnoybacteria bacterium]|nr:glycosyltransferase family 39 protein [Candidatus Portnoybacteria bacterium]
MKFLLNKKNAVILIFLLALASGFFWNHRAYFKGINTGGDEVYYNAIATDILTRHTYTEDGQPTYVEPLYPFFLAAIFWPTNHNIDAVKFVQLFIFGLTAVLIYLLARSIFGEKIGLVAGILSAAFYGLANFTGVLYRENLLVFLCVLMVYSLNRGSREKRSRFFVISGIMLGLMTLLSSTMQFLFIFIIAGFFILFKKQLPLKSIIWKASLFFFAFMLTLSPWLIRNKIKEAETGLAIVPRTGSILSVRTYLMDRLYPEIHKYFLGHIAGYYFAEKIYPDIEMKAFRKYWAVNSRENQLRDEGHDIYQINEIMTKESVKKIIEEPHKYVLISLLAFVDFNNPIVPQRIFNGNESAYFTFAEGRFPQIPWPVKAGLLVSLRLAWITVFFLIIYAIVKNWKNFGRLGWMFLVIVYFNAFYSAVHGLPRYATPIYPFYIILAVAGGAAVWSKYFIKKQPQ